MGLLNKMEERTHPRLIAIYRNEDPIRAKKSVFTDIIGIFLIYFTKNKYTLYKSNFPNHPQKLPDSKSLCGWFGS